MCPDAALLAAYLDGTLFSRDASAVDQHLPTCERCTALLAAMRQQRQADAAATRSRMLTAAAAIAVVALVAVSAVLMLNGSPAPDEGASGPPAAATPAPSPTPPTPTAPRPPRPEKLAIAPAEKTEKPRRPTAVEPKTLPKGSTPPKPPPPRPKAPPAVAAVTTADPTPAPTAVPAPDEAGVTLRGRNANRRVLWRTRDLVIEHSTDGGATWVPEHTADRPIRAGAFVDANVAWLVGEDGLILRRTKNGWFGASPPADGHVTSVRASSPSKATVTLEDGRVFVTDNGGVTWSPR
jgi:outer membrane biosynthesis protein TonB